jgi:hypothetical protein
VERIPQGASRPTLSEKIASRAKAGALVELEVLVEHGAGEAATFAADLPSQLGGTLRVADDGTFGRGAPPKPVVDPAHPDRAHTLLKIPLVFLPTAMTRTAITVPPLRVVVLRKGGGDVDVCTSAHVVDVDQPTANTPDPKVRPNPASVPQITRNERLQEIVTDLAIGAVAGALLLAFVRWMRSRPKELPPPPPPPPPWRVALEEITAARAAFESGKLATKPYYDRVSDAVRVYLGRLFRFDGLELTTDEILARLRKLPSPTLPFGDVASFLGDCDLVKFASYSPPKEEGLATAEAATRIVRALSPYGTGTSWMHAYAGDDDRSEPPPPPPPETEDAS